VVLLTALGPVWPNFIWFRPLTIGLAATTIFATVWVIAVLALAWCHDWRFLVFFIATPFLLYWPATYVFMVGCLSSNSCP
jgi:hypothetical protein